MNSIASSPLVLWGGRPRPRPAPWPANCPTRELGPSMANRNDAVPLSWRTHSCVPRRDSSRRLFAPSHCAPILLLATALFAQTSPPADDNSASVAGVVVNAITGEPVPRAHVMLNGYADGKQRSYGAMTTAEGKFAITGLPAGNYNAVAERVGFVVDQRASYVVELKSADHQNDLTLKLTPAGAISGTVVDADGEPVEHCSVMAQSGRGSQGSTTDAQGRFRIAGLMPGKYRIQATPQEGRLPPEIRTDGTVETHYSRTYFPNSLDEAGAAKVAVQGGAEAAGNEIRLVRTPIVCVSGRVTGIPPGAENIQLMANEKRDHVRGFGFAGYGGGGWTGARVKKDGTFAIWRLTPGPYRIGAQWNGPAGQMAAAPVDVVVGDSNIDGLELRMVAAANLTGQVEYESDDARPDAPAEGKPAGARRGPPIYLQGFDGTNLAVFGIADANGAFTLEKVLPGRYRVSWNGGRGYIKSMRLGQSEIASSILDLSNGVAGATLTLVVSTQFGSVSGTVDANGASTDGMVVALLPADQSPFGMNRWQSGTIGSDGSYALSSLVPGPYRLVVVAQDDLIGVMQGGDEWDEYAPVMETVTIASGDKATQDLRILAR